MPLQAVFFDVGGTLLVEEPGKHLWEMTIQPIAGAVEVLSRLKPSYRIGVISNTVGSGDKEVREALQQAGVAHLVDALVTSRDFGRAKPDPAIYQEAARRLGVPLQASCMVGDRLETDIAGAINAGIPGIWLKPRGAASIDGIRPAHVIETLSELPDVLVTMSSPSVSST
jgi:putative hydrolase of the HAD superfamily